MTQITGRPQRRRNPAEGVYQEHVDMWSFAVLFTTEQRDKIRAKCAVNELSFSHAVRELVNKGLEVDENTAA